MLTIIIGFIMAVGCILLLVIFAEKTYVSVISIAMMLFVLMSALEISSRPLYGYEEPVVKETVLLDDLDFNVEQNQEVFLTIASNTYYLYKAKGEVNVKIISENATKNESNECEYPLLKIYESKAKKGLFSICEDVKITYEFNVPVNTVQEIN